MLSSVHDSQGKIQFIQDFPILPLPCLQEHVGAGFWKWMSSIRHDLQIVSFMQSRQGSLHT